MIDQLISTMIDWNLENIHTAIPAKIETYNVTTMRAEVVPLAKVVLEKNGVPVDMPKIIEVPVSYFRAGNFVIRPPYQVGDVVLVIFSERAIDNLLVTGQTADPQMKRKHALDDAIIIGGLQVKNAPDLPSEEPNSLYIRNMANSTKMIFQPGGDVIISMASANKLYLAQAGASHPVAFADVVGSIFNGHTHTSSSPGNPTSSPNQTMTGHASPQVFTL